MAERPESDVIREEQVFYWRQLRVPYRLIGRRLGISGERARQIEIAKKRRDAALTAPYDDEISTMLLTLIHRRSSVAALAGELSELTR